MKPSDGAQKHKNGHSGNITRKKGSSGTDFQHPPASPPVSVALARQLYQQGQILRSSFDAICLAESFAANRYMVNMIANHLAQFRVEALLPFAEYQRSISDMARAVSIAATIQPLVNEMARIGEVTRSLRMSSVIWAANLNATLGAIADLGLTDSHPQLTARLMDPYVAYEAFVESTNKRLEMAPSQEESAALNGSVKLAQDQLTSATDITLNVMVSPLDGDSPGPSMVLNALQLQQDDLLASNMSTDIERSDLDLLSPAAGTTAMSRQVLSLVADCNLCARVSGRGDIFKPTTRMLKTYSQLPWVVVQDEHTLGQFIDGLFWILYEGAGDDKLRFLDDGLLSDEDCRPVFYVKYLRNKWLRHDPDHGPEAKIRKTWGDVRDVLQALGFSTVPYNPEDYRLLQQRTLGVCIEFLERLHSALEGPPQDPEK